MSPRHRSERPEVKLTDPQREELLVAPLVEWGDPAVHFGSEEERRRTWKAHREELVEKHRRERPGTRPSAWWEFDAPRDRPVSAEDRPEGAPKDLRNEAAWLLELGELTTEERGRCPPPTAAEREHL